MCTSLVNLWRACGVSPPGREKGLKSGQVLVHALPLDRGSMKAVWPFLSHDEQARAASYGRELDALRFAISRTLLRGVLGLYTGINPSNLVFLYGPCGRPRLSLDQAMGLDFNLARRDDCCVIALGLGRCIGIDLESSRSSKLVDATVMMFAEEDRFALEGAQGNDRNMSLIEEWASLEARAKAIGTGICYMVTHNATFTCRKFELGNEWIGCVASEGHNWQMKLIQKGEMTTNSTLSCKAFCSLEISAKLRRKRPSINFIIYLGLI
jgi:phosphopantetheinyl transferase